MMTRKIVFALLAFLLLFAGCGKKSGDAKNEILIICDTSYNLPAAELAAEFKEKTGIDSVITIATGADILALVKIGKEGDILITHDPFLEHVSNAGVLAANAEVGFTASADTPQETGEQPKRVHVIGLNYSENSMAIIQFIEFAREHGPEIFAKYGY
jgi:ABC-type molybdate transport system substrate-binding protein